MASRSSAKGSPTPSLSSNSAHKSSRPTKSSSLRNVIQPKTSSVASNDQDSEEEDEDDDDEDDTMEILARAFKKKEGAEKGDYVRPESSISTPARKEEKGRYERPDSSNRGGVGAALEAAISDRIKEVTKTDSTPNRTQFEQQEDFIQFDASPPPPSSRGSARGPKRKLDVLEEKQEEGTQRVQKRERERTTPWLLHPGVDWSQCSSAIAMLNAEAHSFITYISPTPIEQELRAWTIDLISRVIKSRWSDAEVECFGSVGTGLYLPGGDIDLVVLCPSFPSPPLKPTSSLLHSLASLLLTSSLAEPSSLLVIAKSRVPIVKFVTRYGGFSVDLSVNQQNGVDAAIRVKELLDNFSYSAEDGSAKSKAANGKGKGKKEEGEVSDGEEIDHGVARSLVLLVKAFLNQRGMNEVFTGGLGSYSIICLVVSFLQLHPRIQSGQIHPSRNIGLLFVEFLEYYGKHFNYDECGISLKGTGGYYNKHNKGWWRPNQPYLLSIEDPNDPLNDVSGGSHNIIRVRQTLAGAFEVISATLLQRVSVFSSQDRPNSSIKPLSLSALPSCDPDARDPLSQSVLGSIIGMSRAGIRARQDNIELYADGIIQSLIAKGAKKDNVGTQKKAMKKLRKEEKLGIKQEKTLAKLTQRGVERTAKANRKERRKAEQEVLKAANKEKKRLKKEANKASVENQSDFVGLGGEGEDDEDDDEDDEALVARTLFTESANTSDSRYSIASTANSSRAPIATGTTILEAIFVGSDYSEDNESSFDDDDVIMGGNLGGDSLIAPKAAKPSMILSNGNSLTISSSDSSSDEESSDNVESNLVPQWKKQKMSSPVEENRKKGSVDEEKQAKKDARAAYWSTKGRVLKAGEEDDHEA